MSHVEIIRPRERLSLELGGTGYLSPSKPSPTDVLRAEMEKAQRQNLTSTVLKVRRTSSRHPRRLTLPNGRYLKCSVIGGTGRDWWFVKVSTVDGLRALYGNGE